METTLVTLAQILPILILGQLAELRAVITKGRPSFTTYATGAAIVVFSLLLLALEASFVAVIADPASTEYKMTGEAAGFTIWATFAAFMMCTLFSSYVLIEARVAEARSAA